MSSNGLREAFPIHGGFETDRRALDAVEALLQRGDLSYSTQCFRFPEDYPEDDVVEQFWRDTIIRQGGKSHMRGKLVAARYLEEQGHEVPDTGSLSDPEQWYDVFEFDVPGLEADVTCQCDDDTTVIEIGTTGADRLLKVYGFKVPGPRDDVPPPRIRDWRVHQFITQPRIAAGANETELHIFEPFNLPEPTDDTTKREMREDLP